MLSRVMRLFCNKNEMRETVTPNENSGNDLTSRSQSVISGLLGIPETLSGSL